MYKWLLRPMKATSVAACAAPEATQPTGVYSMLSQETNLLKQTELDSREVCPSSAGDVNLNKPKCISSHHLQYSQVYRNLRYLKASTGSVSWLFFAGHRNAFILYQNFCLSIQILEDNGSICTLMVSDFVS